ncbi:C-C chemokine receptor type 5-like [Latimeria chalumnae]|uniref:C-C chemokine receptor type 5-like n=1 Tax=Latimeria chalumnae TaxID=7897 RepID=UPI0003C12995
MYDYINTSQAYDYTAYNLDYDSFSPCDIKDVKKFGVYFLPILYSLVFVFSLVGNTLVLWVLIKYKKMKSMTDVYLMNLAISDLLVVFSIPFLTHYVLNTWSFGNGMCKLIASAYFIGFYSGIFFITVMSIDRYLAVVHAVLAMKTRTVAYGSIASATIWSAAILASFPELLFIKNEQTQNTCEVNYLEGKEKTWKLFCNFKVMILGLIIPLSIMIYCYSSIIHILIRSRNYKKWKAIKLVFLVIVVFLLFWTPYNIVLFLKSLEQLHYINDCEAGKKLFLANQVTRSIAYVHCCLNPIIYAFAGEKFRKKLSVMFQNCISLISAPKNKAIQSTKSSRAHSMRTQSTSSSENDPIF